MLDQCDSGTPCSAVCFADGIRIHVGDEVMSGAVNMSADSTRTDAMRVATDAMYSMQFRDTYGLIPFLTTHIPHTVSLRLLISMQLQQYVYTDLSPRLCGHIECIAGKP